MKASKNFAARAGFEPATYRLNSVGRRLYQLSYQDLVEKWGKKDNLIFEKDIFSFFQFLSFGTD